MMIPCPNCGVPGRIPSDAVGSFRVARCPRCRHRFELEPSQADVPPSGLGGTVPGDPDEGFDPHSSSYELKAITEDPAERPRQQTGSDPSPATGHAAIIKAEGGAAPAVPTAIGLAMPLAEPWYARVLQAWGVVFLAWAGLLLIRCVYLVIVAGGQPGGVADIVPSTVAVVLQTIGDKPHLP